jgi:hypothetical protein
MEESHELKTRPLIAGIFGSLGSSGGQEGGARVDRPAPQACYTNVSGIGSHALPNEDQASSGVIGPQGVKANSTASDLILQNKKNRNLPLRSSNEANRHAVS